MKLLDQLDLSPMSYADRMRAEAELQRAEVIVDLVSRAGAALKRWSRAVFESLRRSRAQIKSPAVG